MSCWGRLDDLCWKLLSDSLPKRTDYRASEASPLKDFAREDSVPYARSFGGILSRRLNILHRNPFIPHRCRLGTLSSYTSSINFGEGRDWFSWWMEWHIYIYFTGLFNSKHMTYPAHKFHRAYIYSSIHSYIASCTYTLFHPYILQCKVSSR